MNRFIVIALIVAAGWYGNYRYKQHESGQLVAQQVSAAPMPVQSSAAFRCDGRTHCSQMTSCAEATYFLKNCPGTKMDGDGNGVPCERQWCTSGQSSEDEDRRSRRRFK